jgi:hypothetical protein
VGTTMVGRTDKALFIPLMREPFEWFEQGSKRVEMRQYGPRWNERTCRIGRRVTLSLGYGKRRRLGGVITSFHTEHAEGPVTVIYPRGTLLAHIGIRLDGDAGPNKQSAKFQLPTNCRDVTSARSGVKIGIVGPVSGTKKVPQTGR